MTNISKDLIRILLGSTLFAISLNIFLIPVHVYSAGFMGISQLIRDFINNVLNIHFTFDIAGSINFLLNVIVFIFAFRCVSKKFAVLTLLTIFIQTVVLSIIPIPSSSILSEPFVSLIFGSCLCAIGTVITFNGSGSGGGLDIIGVYLGQRNKGSIGEVYTVVNTSIYIVCLIVYDFETAIYSMLSSFILSMVIDKIHDKNIEIELTIITSKPTLIKREILECQQRGLTYWKGKGGYTNIDNEVVVTITTKDRIHMILQKIKELDPNAFVIINESVKVYGNFKKQIV